MLHKCIITKDKTAWSITLLNTYVIYITWYKILKSNYQLLRSILCTLVKIKSRKHYKSLVVHKREINIYNVDNGYWIILESLITYIDKK